MSTATSSVTTSDPSWATPSQVAAPQWQSQEQYQQYYNYYQAMSQATAAAAATPTAPVAPVTTTTVTDPATPYPQDYSKAWDDYYKAYYSQSYAVSAPVAQYPAATYNYDQYGYPNLAAPPPSYQYDSVATSAPYQYTQPPAVTPTATAVTQAYSYTDPNYTAPVMSTWSEPPPSYEKTSSYNQTFQQPSTYEKQPFDQTNLYSDINRSSTAVDPNAKKDSYSDRFPPHTFDNQGYRSNNRGRGYNKNDERPMDSRDDSFRRPPRGNRGQNNFRGGRGGFNERPQYDNEDKPQYNSNNRPQQNSYDRPQYKTNAFQNDDASFGGRGGRPPFRARGGDTSFRGHGRGCDSSYRGRSGFDSQNRSNNQDWNACDENVDYAWKSELEKPDLTKESPWETEEEVESVLPGWTMGGVSHKRKASSSSDNDRPVIKTAPVPLMDIAVRPAGQSSIIVRRQGLIDQWQCAVRDILDRKLPIQQYWTTLKSGLVPEVQGLLCPSFVRGENTIHCELHLDDIFLVQSKGFNEDAAIEEASKSMWQMLQTKLYVHTASRSWGTEKVPVFCVSRCVNGPVSCPPFIKGVAPSDNSVATAPSVKPSMPVFKSHAVPLVVNKPTGNTFVQTKTPGAPLVQPRVAGGALIPAKTQGAPLASNKPPVSTFVQAKHTGNAIGSGVPVRSSAPTSTPLTTNSQLVTAAISNAVAPVVTTPAVVTVAAVVSTPVDHNYKEDDIFLVVDSSQSERDQAISILNNTAKFNHITIDYKHEKPPTAPHISRCLITINGQEFEKSEARDYLFAKREAADKAVVIFKESCPQITLNFDQSCDLARDSIMKPGKSHDESIAEFLKAFAGNVEEDCIYKFGTSFTNEDREVILKMTNNLNLSSKTEGKSILMVFKQYPVEEMKRRILRQGYCAQYRLVVKSSVCPNKGSAS